MLRTPFERSLTRRLSMHRKVAMLVTSTAHLNQLGSRSIQYNSGGKYKAVDNSENHCAHSRSRQRPYASVDLTAAKAKVLRAGTHSCDHWLARQLTKEIRQLPLGLT